VCPSRCGPAFCQCLSLQMLTSDDQIVLILSNQDSSVHDVTLSLTNQQLSTNVISQRILIHALTKCLPTNAPT
jgi:hypothetical protein